VTEDNVKKAANEQAAEVSAGLGEGDYRIIEKERCFDGFFKIDKLTITHKLFAGGWIEPIQRELFVRGDATCLLPYDPVLDKVLLIEQFRVGACMRDTSPWLLEMIAGINEPDESPESVARREAVEEAGIEVGEMVKICDYFVSPGGTNEKVHLYCAPADVAEAGGIHGLRDEGEDIRVVVLSREDAYGLVRSGKIDNAASIMALQWLQLNYQALVAKWAPQS
jgi:ADP-ribose pyrophosphatase